MREWKIKLGWADICLYMGDEYAASFGYRRFYMGNRYKGIEINGFTGIVLLKALPFLTVPEQYVILEDGVVLTKSVITDMKELIHAELRSFMDVFVPIVECLVGGDKERLANSVNVRSGRFFGGGAPMRDTLTPLLDQGVFTCAIEYFSAPVV